MLNSFAINMTSDREMEVSVTQHLCKIIDTPRALTVFLLIKHKEWQQLVDLEIDASMYEDHSNFADDYLVTSILKKSANIPLGIDKHKVALDSFFESEVICRKVNNEFPHCSGIVHEASRWIAKVLGPLDRSTLNNVESGFRFGPGATTGVRGRGSVASDKFDEDIHLTPELIPFYRTMLGQTWWEHQESPIVVSGSKFTTVPKTSKTDRGIAIEPTLNIYGQLGVGRVIRNRLLRFGVDLNSQDRNRDLARRAFREDLATIDMSMASDLISTSVVSSLLPPDWYELLTLFRSNFITIDGESVELEKFSSMGNGYTFELESLIFASLVHTIVPQDDLHLTAIYGDDLIVPQVYADAIINALELLGFKVNHKKSFLAGSFFESCGSDWFREKPVRPFYLRRQKEGKKIPYSLQVANQLRLYSNMRMNGYGCDSRFRPLWVALFKATNKAWRECCVPSSLGDVGFIASQRECKPQRAKHGIEGYYVKTMMSSPLKKRKTTIGLLLANLARAVLPEPTYGREPRRGYLGRYRPRRTLISQWSEEFGWI